MAVPAFSPAEYPPGAKRGNKAVERVHFGVLDVDKKSASELDTLWEVLEPLSWLVYTTWSHGAECRSSGLWRLRVVVPFSRPVNKSEWPSFWPRMAAHFRGLADAQCKDPSRLYFLPSCPAEDAEDVLWETGEGTSLDVDALLTSDDVLPAHLKEVAAQARTETVPLQEVKKLATKMKNATSPYLAQLGRRLSGVLAGDPFAEEGERDTLIFQLTGRLAESFPSAAPDKLAAIFAESLSKMAQQSEGCPTVEDVADKLQRHQDRLAEEQRQQAEKEIEGQALLLRDAFAGEGRETPYTHSEIAQIAASHGITTQELRRRWVIQCNKSYYLLFLDGYRGPQGAESVVNAALRDLAPAASAQVELRKLGRDGFSQKSAQELVRDYGTVAERVVVSLTEEQSHYDATTRTFFEASCHERKLTPSHSPEVASWLERLCGDQYETVCDWLTVITDLREPCAALYFDGPPGTGKTLFADGLARIWTKQQPTSLEYAMAEFNDALTRCPLVLGDETIPTDWKGRPRTADLRQFIQARTRTLNRKFLSTSELRGAARVVITANNNELLTNTQETLSPNDIRAITDRLIYVKCGHRAAGYLQALGMERVRSFVADDEVARHALWLRDNREVERGKRFYVEGTDSSLHRLMTTSAGLRSAVCNWLVSYLLSPGKVDSLGERLVHVYKGQLYATARGLSERWDFYETHERSPQTGRIARALKGLSNDKRQFTAGDGRKTNYHQIDPENLVTWAENNGYATREALLGALASAPSGSHGDAGEGQEGDPR